MLLGCAERTELCLTASVGLIWTAIAPLYGDEKWTRAVLAIGCCAAPFFGLAVVADTVAGAELEDMFALALIGMAWSLGLAGAAAAGRRSGRHSRFLGLWVLVALVLPAMALALGLAGQADRSVVWMIAVSAPAWLASHCSLDSTHTLFDGYSGAALPSAVLAASVLAGAKWAKKEQGVTRAS